MSYLDLVSCNAYLDLGSFGEDERSVCYLSLFGEGGKERSCDKTDNCKHQEEKQYSFLRDLAGLSLKLPTVKYLQHPKETSEVPQK